MQCLLLAYAAYDKKCCFLQSLFFIRLNEQAEQVGQYSLLFLPRPPERVYGSC